MLAVFMTYSIGGAAKVVYTSGSRRRFSRSCFPIARGRQYAWEACNTFGCCIEDPIHISDRRGLRLFSSR